MTFFVPVRLHSSCLLMDDDKKMELPNGFDFLTHLEFVDAMPNAPLGVGLATFQQLSGKWT